MEHIKIGLHCNGDISIYLNLYQTGRRRRRRFRRKNSTPGGYHIPHFSPWRLYTFRILYDRNCHLSLFAYHFMIETILLLASGFCTNRGSRHLSSTAECSCKPKIFTSVDIADNRKNRGTVLRNLADQRTFLKRLLLRRVTGRKFER